MYAKYSKKLTLYLGVINVSFLENFVYVLANLGWPSNYQMKNEMPSRHTFREKPLQKAPTKKGRKINFFYSINFIVDFV